MPIGPGFKRTDLKAGMRIKFPYQDQQFTGTIDGFNLISGREVVYVDGVARYWDEFDLRPVVTILLPEIVLPEVKKKAKKIAGTSPKPSFKLVKKLRKKIR